MNLKFKNSAVDIPNWLVVVGLIFADGIYANHCRKKTAAKILEVSKAEISLKEKES